MIGSERVYKQHYSLQTLYLKPFTQNFDGISRKRQFLISDIGLIIHQHYALQNHTQEFRQPYLSEMSPPYTAETHVADIHCSL